MSINIYWACLEKEWFLAEEPQPVFKRLNEKNLININEPYSQINKCPAFADSVKNLFSIKSFYDYEFTIDIDSMSSQYTIKSNNYDQEFFDEHVLVRSFEKRFFSFFQKYIFFTDEKSLNATYYIYPFLEDNNITKRCLIPPGQFDIGKWFRNTEFAFYLKDGFNSFKIEKDEIFAYIKFDTKEKINFHQFRYNENFEKYKLDGWAVNKMSLKTMENYYKSFKNKKLILNEVKKNLI